MLPSIKHRFKRKNSLTVQYGWHYLFFLPLFLLVLLLQISAEILIMHDNGGFLGLVSRGLLATYPLFYWFLPILVGSLVVLIQPLPRIVIYRLQTSEAIMRAINNETFFINSLYLLAEVVLIVFVMGYSSIMEKSIDLTENLASGLILLVYNLHVFVLIFAVLTLKNGIDRRLNVLFLILTSFSAGYWLYFRWHLSIGIFKLSDQVIQGKIAGVSLLLNTVVAILCFSIVWVVSEQCLNKKDFLIQKI